MPQRAMKQLQNCFVQVRPIYCKWIKFPLVLILATALSANNTTSNTTNLYFSYIENTLRYAYLLLNTYINPKSLKSCQ